MRPISSPPPFLAQPSSAPAAPAPSAHSRAAAPPWPTPAASARPSAASSQLVAQLPAWPSRLRPPNPSARCPVPRPAAARYPSAAARACEPSAPLHPTAAVARSQRARGQERRSSAQPCQAMDPPVSGVQGPLVKTIFPQSPTLVSPGRSLPAPHFLRVWAFPGAMRVDSATTPSSSPYLAIVQQPC
jgi:hypothetical protein